MSSWTSMITNRGRALQAKAQAGTPLQYTRFRIGDGRLTSQTIPALTDLISPIKYSDVKRIRYSAEGGNQRSLIGTDISTAGLATGFFFREFGIYAMDPDVGEILYWYGNAGDTADYITPEGAGGTIDKVFNVLVYVGTASQISASVDQSIVYVTQQEFDDALANLDFDVIDSNTSTDKTKPPSADALRRTVESMAEALALKQNVERLADNYKKAAALPSEYPDGPTFFKITGGLVNGWPVDFGNVTVKRTGSSATMMVEEVVTSGDVSDPSGRVFFRNKRDANSGWQPFVEVSTKVDYVRQPGYAVTGGTGAAYTAALSPQPAALVDGLSITIVPHAVNTAADPTLKIGTLGALPIRRQSGGTFAAGTIKAGAPLSLVKVGSYFLARSAPAIGTATAAQVLAGKTFQSEAHPDGGIGTATEYSNNARPVSPAATPGAGSDSVNFYVKVPPGWYDDTIYVRWNDPNFVSDNILGGKTVHGLAGSIPVLTGIRSAQGVGQWADGGLAVYPERGYQKGGPGDGEIKVLQSQITAAEPDLGGSNVRQGVNIFGVVGNLVPQSLFRQESVFPGFQYTAVNFGFIPKIIFVYSPDPNFRGLVRGVVNKDHVNGQITQYRPASSSGNFGVYISHTTGGGAVDMAAVMYFYPEASGNYPLAILGYA